ncbi:hypothetical protein MRQ36_02210 [Micromonospora sp. R77]|nr:hypothetical protein [Micromonospora sp. R77]MCI4061452.1 hypothetical protein [Micromonospora sp. R77]
MTNLLNEKVAFVGGAGRGIGAAAAQLPGSAACSQTIIGIWAQSSED